MKSMLPSSVEPNERDSSSSTALLLSSKEYDENIDEDGVSLQTRVEAYPSAKVLLRLSASIWIPGDDTLSHGYKIYFVCVRVLLVACSISSLIMCLWYAIAHKPAPIIIIMLAMTIIFISVIPGQRANQEKLRMRSGISKQQLDKCMLITALYSTIAVVFVLCAIAATAAEMESLHTTAWYQVLANIYGVGLLYLTGYLSFNLLMLLVDLHVALAGVEWLLLACHSKTVTTQQLCSTRDAVHSAQRESIWTTNIILVPCVAAVVDIICIVFLLNNTIHDPYIRMANIAYIGLNLKEVMFLAIAFWYVAEVNGRADELTLQLSKPSATFTADIERLQLHATSISDPISYKLLFLRISWRSVGVSATGFCVSLLVGVVKNVMGL
jgi:hypothetical protein